MKRKIIAVSTILLVALLIVGASMAWFTDTSAEEANEFQMGTVQVKVVEEGFEDLENVIATTYNKNVQVQSLGTKKTYVRVRLVPEWSVPSLPVSNVELNLADNSDWMLQDDGHYYFKYYLEKDDTTSPLLESVTFTELPPEYEGATFTLKVVAEGVQITHEAWKDVWGLENLPFTAEKAWIPLP
jgi:predicted ribosomally synthesized peptide with SipW-like signal peptide